MISPLAMSLELAAPISCQEMVKSLALQMMQIYSTGIIRVHLA